MALIHVSMLVVYSRSGWIQCSWMILNKQLRRRDFSWYFSTGRKVSVLLQYGLPERPKKYSSIWLVYVWKISPVSCREWIQSQRACYSLASPCRVYHKKYFCGLWDCSLGAEITCFTYIIELLLLAEHFVHSQAGWTRSKNKPSSSPLGLQFYSLATPTASTI